MGHIRDIGIASAAWLSGVLLLFLLLIAPANANPNVTIGPIKGEVYLNQKLNVFVSLKGENSFKASQLHSSCLKGEIIDRSKAASFDTIVQDAIIRFESTIRNGGLLRIESSDKILSPLSILQIKSVCPLAQFDHAWSLLASPVTNDAAKPSEPKTTKTNFVQEPRAFKLGSSTLLSESKKVPDAWLTAKEQVAIYEEKRAKEQQNSLQLQEEAELARYQSPVEALIANEPPEETADSPINTTDAEESIKIEDERVELAQAKLANMTQEGQYSSSQELEVAANQSFSPPVQTGFVPDTTTAIAILLVVMLLLGVTYYIIKKYGLSKIKALFIKKGQEEVPAPPVNIEPELLYKGLDQAEQEEGDVVEEELVTKPGRMFQSLLDDDNEQVYQELNEARRPEEAALLTDASMEIIEQLKIDRRYPWDLPDTFRAIVDQTTIELTDEEWQNMRLSKSQIAVVELAFKKATMSEDILESEYDLILDYMQIRGQDDEKAVTCESISELIKNYVQAKIFEQENQGLVALFIENLESLSKISTTRSLCFGSQHWFEFVESLKGN